MDLNVDNVHNDVVSVISVVCIDGFSPNFSVMLGVKKSLLLLNAVVPA